MTILKELLGPGNTHISIDALRWDDLRAPATAINPPGQVSDPDIDTDGTMLFDPSSTELIAIIFQMPHAWLEGSAVVPHIHWGKTSDASGDVKWQWRWRRGNPGEVLGAWTSWADLSVVAGTPDTDTEDNQMISSASYQDMTACEISCLLVMQVRRLGGDAADTYGADARLWEVDIHYINDSGPQGSGSRQEFIKQGHRR